MNAGAVGVVTNGGARDTDELIKQKCPVYARFISRGFMPGRVEFDAVNTPVNCGGARVRPGDMIVADGDGVVVVPVEQAEAVAKIARGILDSDKRGRRKLYEKRGLPPDSTVTE
jgi:regulator of RNase E activity RraA